MSVTNNAVDLEYISTACNRSPSCAGWNSNNILCFGASSAVCLLDTEVNDESIKITKTLSKHTAKVNCVCWIKKLGFQSDDIKENEIISGSSDNSAIIWKENNGEYHPACHLKEHKCAVTIVDAKYVKKAENTSLYVATSSVDSTIKLWKNVASNDEIQCIQTISLGNGLCLALQLNLLPNTNTPILAAGLDDNKIYLFVEMVDNLYEKLFQKVMSLVGHDDWVRGLDFITIDSRLMLASCSQDTYIRLWSIERHKQNPTNDDEIRSKKELFAVDETNWMVSLDAVLSGHEGWVYSVQWNNARSMKDVKLLSASIDKSLIIWEPSLNEGVEGVWSESIRVGEVGGSGLGFYGGKFSHDGNSIIGHGYTGSFHMWRHKKESSSWEPSVICGGHFNGVVDIGWDPDGEFLISASTDQTVRIHAPWNRNDDSKSTWHEIARPQIHGFDMSCLAIISKYNYASGAEEKVIRVFQAPKNFITNFYSITGKSEDNISDECKDICQGASVPSLGLSNKAVYDLEEPSNESKHVKDQYPTSYFTPVDMKEPPTEETLMQNTLWPETFKLYGHGYEVFALAASSDGQLLASVCKATTPQHACILLWDTEKWVQKQSLKSHHLTVTQLAFSPNSQMLLSVSRDRRWSVFQKTDDNTFSLIATTDKTNGIHTRIIWCCAWTMDSKNFFTGSRDGKVVLWEKDDNTLGKSTGPFSPCVPLLELPSQSVTAVATVLSPNDSSHITAIGLESGAILVYKISLEKKIWQEILSLNNSMAHHLTVRRLLFRPRQNTQKDVVQLASCSDDHIVKIYNIKL